MQPVSSAPPILGRVADRRRSLRHLSRCRGRRLGGCHPGPAAAVAVAVVIAAAAPVKAATAPQVGALTTVPRVFVCNSVC